MCLLAYCWILFCFKPFSQFLLIGELNHLYLLKVITDKEGLSIVFLLITFCMFDSIFCPSFAPYYFLSCLVDFFCRDILIPFFLCVCVSYRYFFVIAMGIAYNILILQHCILNKYQFNLNCIQRHLYRCIYPWSIFWLMRQITSYIVYPLT